MNARPKRRGRRDDGRRSFRLDAAKCASTGEAPVADDIRFDRRNLDFVIFADQFPRGVRRESSAALLAYARRGVAKLIGIVRKPTGVRLMPQLRPAGARGLALFLFVRRGRLRRRARILIGSLKLEHQLDQLLFAQVLQISAVHRPKDSEIDAHGKGVGNCASDIGLSHIYCFILAALFFGMAYTPLPAVYPLVCLLGLLFAEAT